MPQTQYQPRFVLVCWPLWCVAEPERTERTRFYVGLHQPDDTITILWGPTRDQAEAVELIGKPDRIKLLLKMDREDELWRQRMLKFHDGPFDDPKPEQVRAAVGMTRKPPPGLFGEGGT